MRSSDPSAKRPAASSLVNDQGRAKASVEVIIRASNIIKDLVSFNRNILDVSQSGISHYRSMSDAAQGKTAELERQCTELRDKLDGLMADFGRATEEFQNTIESQRLEIERLRSLLWPK